MKRFAVVGALAACGGGGDRAEPAAGSAPGSAPAPAPAITAQLAGCSAALAAPVDPREPVAYPAGPWVRPDVPRVRMQAPSVRGGDLDLLIVRRYLRRNLARFTYCYEVRLLVEPTLAGVVETAFAIQPSGKVASATADGVDAEVARCIAEVVERIEFPRPRDGNQVQVRVPLALAPGRPVVARPPRTAPREWTPFAAAAAAPAEVARPVVEVVTSTARDRLGPIEHCFDGARGAVRAMLAFDVSGGTRSVRAGGIGDSAIESCIASALGGITVPPPAEPVEVACDFTRGGDAPLRVSPDAGYTVIELTSREVRNRSSVREIPPRGGGTRSVTMLGTMSSVLVVAEPDAPGHGLEYALWWAPAGTTLVAVKASGGAPVLLGMGDSRMQRRPATARRVLELRTDGGRLRACVGGGDLPDTAPLLDARAMDRVLAAAAAACRQTPCEPTIVVGTTGEFVAKDLVATTSAARRAGFHQISIGGPACEP